MKLTILIVDDEPSIRSSLQGLLQDEGYQTLTATGGEEALLQLQKKGEAISAVLLDVWMSGINGLDVLKRIQDLQPDLPVLMMSGHASIETAVEATKKGAYHFIEKPFSSETLVITVRNAIKQRQLRQENQVLKTRLTVRGPLLGNSVSFTNLLRKVERVAISDSWVLIHGENGTGKESIAWNIHQKSQRAKGPFVEVNCAAIPENLIESELFGHEKGAFTGAISCRNGRFDQAHQGTLFLDEIADMSLSTQAKILRVLQEQHFERVGGSETIHVNVRVVAASNKKLEDEIMAGKFREDLYYRLNVLPLKVPPLRERYGDVSLLAEYYLAFLAKNNGWPQKSIQPDAMKILENHPWPGNVRELRNVVERLIILCTQDKISPSDIHDALGSTKNSSSTNYSEQSSEWLDGTYSQAEQAFQVAYLSRKLNKCQWNVSKTAEEIELDRSNLHKKIKKLQLTPP